MPDLRDDNLVRNHGTGDKTRTGDAQKLIKWSLRIVSLVCTLIRPMLTGVKHNVGIALECFKKRTYPWPDLDDKVKVPVGDNINTRNGWSSQQHIHHTTTTTKTIIDVSTDDGQEKDKLTLLQTPVSEKQPCDAAGSDIATHFLGTPLGYVQPSVLIPTLPVGGTVSKCGLHFSDRPWTANTGRTQQHTPRSMSAPVWIRWRCGHKLGKVPAGARRGETHSVVQLLAEVLCSRAPW